MSQLHDASEARDAIAARLPRRGRLALALGLVGVAAAVVFAWRDGGSAATHIKLTAGYEGTTRSLVAHALARELSAHGTECEVIAEGSSQHEVESLRSGAVDFALVSAVYRNQHRDPGVRVVAPLQLEALHLLVKRELAARVSEDLAGLDGLRVDLGPEESAGAELVGEVLAFAGRAPASEAEPAGHRPLHLDPQQLESLIDRGAHDELPDAFFHLATLPSLLAQRLVREAGYALVPLPFAEAFRLQAILAADAGDAGRRDADRLVTDVVIPPFLYQTQPAVPAAPLPTLGARLLLLAHERVSDATVERVLTATYDSRFAHMLHPSLDRSLLAGVPRRDLHAGTVAYLARRAPAITGEAVDNLSNTLSVLGALVGSGAFVLQGWRQRQRAQRERLVASHLLRVAALERRIVESELSANLDLDTLIDVQRGLLQLKGEALERFTSGELDDQSMLSSLLDPVNAARDHVGELLLHVRSQLDEKAQTEGRTSSAVWAEASNPEKDDT